jgi:predicted ester cyclase
MDEAAIRSLVDNLVHAWNDRDLDRLIGYMDESVVWDDPAMVYGPAKGRDAVRAFSESVIRAFPDFSYRVREPICIAHSGDRAAIPWEIMATHTGRFDPPGFAPTGQRVKMVGVDLLELRDTKVVRIDTFFNSMAAAEQVLRLRFPRRGLGKALAVGLQRWRAFWLRRSPREKQ